MNGFIWCAGCDREGVIHLRNFPDDYPQSLMMCCACTSSFYWYLGILVQAPRTNGYHCTDFFCEKWWNAYGEKIEKAMRLQ